MKKKKSNAYSNIAPHELDSCPRPWRALHPTPWRGGGPGAHAADTLAYTRYKSPSLLLATIMRAHLRGGRDDPRSLRSPPRNRRRPAHSTARPP